MNAWTGWFTWLAPLAQIAPSARFAASFKRSGFRFGFWNFWLWVYLSAAFVVGYFVVSFLRKRNDMSERCDDPAKLFRELCLTHQLDGSHRRLLRRLAAASGMEHPAQAFLAPWAFDAEELPPSLEGQRDAVAKLRAKLF